MVRKRTDDEVNEDRDAREKKPFDDYREPPDFSKKQWDNAGKKQVGQKKR